MDRLRRIIESIDRRGYKAYSRIKGEYDFRNFRLFVDRVQGDPFASPSVVRVEVENHGFPPDFFSDEPGRVALRDYLYRLIHIRAKKVSRPRGTGGSGIISVPPPGQIIIPRTGVQLDGDKIVARLFVGLPARGRTIDGHAAYEMFFMDIPEIVKKCLFAQAVNMEHLRDFIVFHRDQVALRRMLTERGIIAFVADGAVLPRESGISDKPMVGGKPFRSPKSFLVEFTLPSGRKVAGMGIPEGTTLIVGGGYHGKTTLLDAIQNGVYFHIPGDGREWVITHPDAVKIRAEDGRSVRGVDISAFIRELPQKKDTRDFSTDDASGSTSMAAAIVEAVESGAKVLLFDEDTSATNFMIKDDRMVELIQKEPIVPLVDRLEELRALFGISVIIVVGGAGEYLDVAERVILMEEFEPSDASERARQITEKYPAHRARKPEPMEIPRGRIILRRGFSAAKGRKSEYVKVKGKNLVFGTQTIDLSAVEQIILPEQIRGIGRAMAYLEEKIGEITVADALDMIEEVLRREGLSGLVRWGAVPPDIAYFRRHELAAAINRLRTLAVKSVPARG